MDELPISRSEWDACDALVDEGESTWESFLSEDSSPHCRPIIRADTEQTLRKAELACSTISKRGDLQHLTLKDTKPIDVCADRPFRMWYPQEIPKRIPLKQAVFCEPSTAAAKEVNWSKILPDEDVVHEVKMREKRLRTDISTDPSARRRLLDYIRTHYKRGPNLSYVVDDLDLFAHADIPDYQSDILRQCSVSIYYPDVNYAIESSKLREALIRKLDIRRMKHSEKLEVAIPGSSNTIAICDGGACELIPSGISLSLLVNVPEDEDLEQYCLFFCEFATKIRRLTESERRILSHCFDTSRMEVFENPLLVQFASTADCNEAFRKHGRRRARILPHAFIVGNDYWNGISNARMTFRVKWYKRPSCGEALLKFKNADDSRLAAEILIFHGYSDSEKHSRISDDTRVIKIIPSAYQHNHIFREHMQEILGANGVSIQNAYLLRCNRSKHDINLTVQQHLSRAIIQYLIRHHEWTGHMPFLEQEWRTLLSSNDLPWRWNMLDIRNTEEGEGSPSEAELIFKNINQGLRLVEYLMSDSEDLLMFDQRFRSSQKITIKPVYCIFVMVTKEVRVACDTLIRQLSDEESAVTKLVGDTMEWLEILDVTWQQNGGSSDDCDNTVGELSVQGWPVRRVEEVATRLFSMFEGTYIDCSDEIYGKLLYGFGARYVELAREKLRGRAVIDVDLLRERITVVGEAADLAKKKMTFFAENSHAFVISEIITIGPPRYLFFMRDILYSRVGLKRLRKICGRADLSFVTDCGIKFTGTLQQYDLLLNYLEEVDEKLVRSSSPSAISSKPICPVCLSPVRNSFFCLECGHYYCLKCITFQVKTLIKNRDLPMRCAQEDCEQILSVADLKRLILGDERLPWLSAAKLQPLIDSSIDCLVRKNPNLTRCPTPSCYGICKRADENTVFLCDSCNKEWCRRCLLEPHNGVSCDEYAVLRVDGTASLKAYMDKNSGKVRICPAAGCGAVIEKGEGCNHMQCRVCEIHFCWLCDFKSETQSEVYGHLRCTHGFIGEDFPMHEIPVEADAVQDPIIVAEFGEPGGDVDLLPDDAW